MVLEKYDAVERLAAGNCAGMRCGAASHDFAEMHEIQRARQLRLGSTKKKRTTGGAGWCVSSVGVHVDSTNRSQ